MTPTDQPSHSKPPCSREDALVVVRKLRSAGHIAFFAGGCVRDMLLQREPKDYDVATDALPGQVRRLFNHTQAVGAAFGVILVRIEQSVIEVATFRSDGAYLDGRRPAEVHFTTAEHDAQRRDFTINGLFFDPTADEVIDYVGGQQDLAAKVIRAIGDPDKRFEEDHLRLLRAVRFAARLGFTIEPATATAIRRHAPQLIRISPERIADELRTMLPAPTGGWAWRALLVEFSGLAQVIFRYLAPQPLVEVRESYVSVFSVREQEQRRWPVALALAAMSMDWLLMQPAAMDLSSLLQRASVQKIIRALRQALRLSNDELEDIQGALDGLGLLIHAAHPPAVATVKRFLARPTSALSRQLLQSSLCSRALEPDRLAELIAMVDQLAATDFAPPPLVTGDDLTAAGLSPGPIFKRVLDATYDEQLEGRVHSREEAMAFALGVAHG